MGNSTLPIGTTEIESFYFLEHAQNTFPIVPKQFHHWSQGTSQVDTSCTCENIIALCARVMCSVAFVCVCVYVCMTKKHLFTHLLAKCLCKKDTYCSLIYFTCRQRCLLDLLSHTESAISDVSIHVIVSRGLWKIIQYTMVKTRPV